MRPTHTYKHTDRQTDRRTSDNTAVTSDIVIKYEDGDENEDALGLYPCG